MRNALIIGLLALVAAVASSASGSSGGREGVSSLTYRPKPVYNTFDRLHVIFTTTGRARRGFYYRPSLFIQGPGAGNGCDAYMTPRIGGDTIGRERRILGAPGRTYSLWLRANAAVGSFCHGRARLSIASVPIHGSNGVRILRRIWFRVLRGPGP